MSTAVANSAAHHVNLASLPPLPRIRPPRLLKGDPHPNNKPRPQNQPSASNRVWVQGKWRNPTSNAAEQHREVQYRRVSKALRHRTHGLDIYAYRHVRTNQVVYSLSRSLQVCSQPLIRNGRLITHGVEYPSPQTTALPWQENRARGCPSRHVDPLFLCTFPRQLRRSLHRPGGIQEPT